MVIADSGFWLALANKNDHYHDRVSIAFSKIDSPLITTWPVITETCHLLLKFLNTEAQLTFIENFHQKAFKVFELAEDHVPRMIKLMKKYSDLPMDVADASLVVVAEDIGTGDILSTDMRDFRTYRWKNHKPFKNILHP